MTTGPLRVHPENSRYFTDGLSGHDGRLRAIYLTGAHTWNNLVDMGEADPPEAFDFDRYLAFLDERGHNFARLWAWDCSTWDTRANEARPEQADIPMEGKAFVHRVAPLPWARGGPGIALDGRPKFDLTTFDPRFFERLRSRVRAAGAAGVYTSVMLFEGWALTHGHQGRANPPDWAWRAHPFNPANNVNGIDAAGEPHRVGNEPVNRLQETYVRQVVETVNDQDNVLFEVINEGGERAWDWWVVDTIHDHERTLPKQHPVGVTGHGAESLADMLASPADWVSPGGRDGYEEDPPAWVSPKVSFLDTDHIWGLGGDHRWAWKAFLRGHNPIFMDVYDGAVLGPVSDPRWEPLRGALGQTRRLALRVDLAAMRPHDELSSTRYCLANPPTELVVYQPDPGQEFTVELDAGAYDAEWLDPVSGDERGAGSLDAPGGRTAFRAPFDGDAVLHLRGH